MPMPMPMPLPRMLTPFKSSPLSTGLVGIFALALLSAAPQAHAKKKPKPATAASSPSTAQRDDVPDLVTYGRREDVMRFGAEIAERRGLDTAWVLGALQRARFAPAVAKAIMPPPAGTAKNWALYRSRFIEPIRVRAGATFWRANAQWLAEAEARYGVPPEIVVGIIGVETIYGQQMGNFRTLDALATLA
ncbi:MAG: lytic murein transglycosylase, partial [Rhizobacter sp.]|nr:lytic murein transglycosylase [Rhizobacter sp.]